MWYKRPGIAKLPVLVNNSGSKQVLVRNVEPQWEVEPTIVFNFDTDGRPNTLTVTGAFSDVGLLDSHTLAIRWPNGILETHSVNTGAFSFTKSMLGTEPANNKFTVTINDDDRGTSRFVLYDPAECDCESSASDAPGNSLSRGLVPVTSQSIAYTAYTPSIVSSGSLGSNDIKFQVNYGSRLSIANFFHLNYVGTWGQSWTKASNSYGSGESRGTAFSHIEIRDPNNCNTITDGVMGDGTNRQSGAILAYFSPRDVSVAAGYYDVELVWYMNLDATSPGLQGSGGQPIGKTYEFEPSIVNPLQVVPVQTRHFNTTPTQSRVDVYEVERIRVYYPGPISFVDEGVVHYMPSQVRFFMYEPTLSNPSEDAFGSRRIATFYVGALAVVPVPQ